MIPRQHKQEQLSKAYINAVVAHAGHTFSEPQDDYGVDGSMHKIASSANGRRYDSGIVIDVQLKATTDWTLQDDFVVYDVEAKTFNDLAIRFQEDRATEMILAVLCLPQDENEWLSITNEQLILKKCCYWCKISDQSTNNTSSKRIKIPKDNLFSPEAVIELLEKVAKGEKI